MDGSKNGEDFHTLLTMIIIRRDCHETLLT